MIIDYYIKPHKDKKHWSIKKYIKINKTKYRSKLVCIVNSKLTSEIIIDLLNRHAGLSYKKPILRDEDG